MALRIFAILNWMAFFGWSFVGIKLLQSKGDAENVVGRMQMTVLKLEGICMVELMRIFLGKLKGNLVLGVVLHAIRLVTLLETIPRLPNHWTGVAILGSWAATEVFRYPMYIYPEIQKLRSIRLVVPLATFPVGAFSEAWAAYLVFCNPESSLGLKAALSVVLFVNGILGPTLAYPALLKKGLPILGLTKTHRDKSD